MISTVTAIIAVLLAILTLVVPRRLFLLPYILAACFIPADQRIIVFSLDFTVLRILVLVGVLRIGLRGESIQIRWTTFDKLILAWALCGAGIYVLQWANISAAVYKSGVLFDVLGLYWLSRRSLRSVEDIRLVATVFAWCALVMCPFIALERASGSNPFAFMGIVHTVLREGRFRCQGPFPHSIMLGSFWAGLIPLFVALTKGRRSRTLFWAAAVASTFMTVMTASSGPVLMLVFVLLLVSLFRYRGYGRHAAWTLLALTVALHLAMKAPVWHLISRVDVIGGSTGWHRYHVIDQFIAHFSEWALVGTRSTLHWGSGLWDITNQYCLEGVRGGLVTLILFVMVLIVAIRETGRWSLKRQALEHQWLAWGLTVSLLGHCISFMGVSYFGQITMLLYLTFGAVGLVAETQANRSLHSSVQEAAGQSQALLS